MHLTKLVENPKEMELHQLSNRTKASTICNLNKKNLGRMILKRRLRMDKAFRI
jgi:hypothetical protein